MEDGSAALKLRPHIVAVGAILALLLVLVGGTIYLRTASYFDTLHGAHDAAETSSQVVAANVGWAYETARQTLLRVDGALGPDITNPPLDATEQLKEALGTLPGSPKIYVVDVNGTTQLTTDEEFKPLDVRDREYFAAVADGTPFHISSLIVSRLNGEQIFVFSKRLERDGQFAGAAILSFNSGLLEGVWRSLRLDDKSTVGLLRDDGQLVSRYPLPTGPQDLSNYILFTEYLKQAPSGTYDAVSPTDGVQRVVGYRRVPGTNLIALSSLSAEGAFASFWSATWGVLALVIPALVGLVLIARWTFDLLRRDAREREAEAQFRVFAEAMPNHVWSAQPDGMLDWFNSGVYRYSGRSPGELDGGNWTSILHPDDLPEAARRWHSATTSGRDYEVQFRLRSADGTYRWHLARAVALRNANGSIVKWVGTNTDIDDEKATLGRLAESEARLRLAIEAGQMAIWELDIDALSITPSPALNRLYGFPDDATPTVAEYQSRYAPGEAERVGAISAATVARGDLDLEAELRHLWPDGTEKWLLIRSQLSPGSTLTSGRAIGVVMDVTERRRIEEQLRRSEQRFRLSQHAADIASLELDIATGMVIGSEKFWEIWGLEPRESVHISVLEDIVVPEDKDIRSTEATRQAGTSVPSVEYRIRRPDTRELRWLSRHIEFTYDEAGKPLKMYGIMQDVTEQKDARTRQEILTHELSHRIKNILAMVSALASQTLRDTTIEAGRDALAQRLRALATAHDALLGRNWTDAPMRDVIEAAMAHLPTERIEITGPSFALSPKMALSMALAVNELGTNALKYGALSNDDGRVVVGWTVTRNDGGERILEWTWTESGGPVVNAPTRRGFGSLLIRRVLATDFDGEVDVEFAPEGLKVRLTSAIDEARPEVTK
jgi:PAS domain S-box-containing protein